MRYYRVYRLIDPRYPLDDHRHIRYIGYTARKLPDELQRCLSSWPRHGGPKHHLLRELLSGGIEPGIALLEKVQSASEAKERMEHWVHHCEEQGYELINVQLDERLLVWDRQRVIEDFQIEAMRLLRGVASPYSITLDKLSQEGMEGSALYTYLQAAETPDLSIEEIPALFRERDERVKGLERRVMRAIDSGEIQEPIASDLREAIEEGERSIAEEGSAVEDYITMITALAAKNSQGVSEGK